MLQISHITTVSSRRKIRLSFKKALVFALTLGDVKKHYSRTRIPTAFCYYPAPALALLSGRAAAPAPVSLGLLGLGQLEHQSTTPVLWASGKPNIDSWDVQLSKPTIN